jgi:hypothetical protein
MTLTSVVLLAAVAFGVAGVALLLGRLHAYRGQDTENKNGYSPAYYEPMRQLLDPQDVDFLASQPGVGRDQISEFNRNRRKIFRMYLRELAADFRALHRQARELVAASPEKSGDLVEMLLRQQVRFWMGLVAIEMQLAMESAGLGAVNPKRLLETVDALHAAVTHATASPGPVAL